MTRGRVPGHVLVVGAREEVVGKLVGQPAAVTLVQRPGAFTSFSSVVACRTLAIDFTDFDALLSAVTVLHGRRPIDAVVSFTEPGLLPAADVATRLGVRGNPRDAVLSTRDKGLMRSRLEASGVSPVRSLVARSPDDIASVLGECPDGVIVKPRDGTGSAGVSLVAADGDITAAWSWCKQAGAQGGVLVEQYLRGVELSVESLSADGRHVVLAVTRKLVTGPPHFVELGHDMPAPIDDDTRSAVHACTIRALDALGHAWGPAHTEVIVGADGVRIVEVNTRVGGDRIWEMVELVTGVDLVRWTLLALLEERLPDPRPARAHASVRFLQASTPGVCAGIEGIDDARDVAGVVRIGELPCPGSAVSALRSSADRCGYVLACAPDGDGAARAADAGVAAMRVLTLAPS